MEIGIMSLRVTKSREVSAWSRRGWVSKVSRLTTSKPREQATQSFDLKKSIDDDSAGT